MATQVYHNKLSTEDLMRLRMVVANKKAVEIAPNQHSSEEVRRALMDYYKVLGELIATYEVDDTRDWALSEYSGNITYEV